MDPQINYKYLLTWVITITIGFFLFGYSLASFNSLTSFMYYHYKQNNAKGFYMENIDKFNSMITSIVPVGAIVGVIFGNKLATIGRRKSIIILDII